MAGPITRRAALIRSMLAAPALARALTRSADAADAAARLAELERTSGGRLGVAALDAGVDRRVVHRGGERFPMCSTFKLLAVALVLARADRGDERLGRRVTFTPQDLVPHSPVTGERTGATGMTLEELCEAAMTISDNTAANLLLASFGGPAALTTYARSLGDPATRLDRIEVELNEATPGDPRDTTTPAAMLENVRRLVLGDALSERSRQRLTNWLVANRKGDARLRAGFPRGWRVGDKTGTGDYGTSNDVAVAWPPDRPPLLVCAYYTDSSLPVDDRNAVLAEVARIVVSR